ncbi:MAG: patatin-like phospholipase family protein [Petrotogales bacterium]
MKNILILAGCGCKGFIQSQVLKKLEQEYGPLYKRYSLICGTSVGSINGSMIASGRITMDRFEDARIW